MTHNLRTGRVNLNYSSNDVKWCPIVANKQTIVTAATNGAIGIWDVSSSNKQLRVIAEHPRAVNRVCFHPTNAFQLLSASIDGTVRMWDTRESASSATFQGKAESARDVQFCPSEPFAFAAVFETGVVQVRRPLCACLLAVSKKRMRAQEMGRSHARPVGKKDNGPQRAHLHARLAPGGSLPCQWIPRQDHQGNACQSGGWGGGGAGGEENKEDE